jgi:hypothetical protein
MTFASSFKRARANSRITAQVGRVPNLRWIS